MEGLATLEALACRPALVPGIVGQVLVFLVDLVVAGHHLGVPLLLGLLGPLGRDLALLGLAAGVLATELGAGGTAELGARQPARALDHLGPGLGPLQAHVLI